MDELMKELFGSSFMNINKLDKEKKKKLFEECKKSFTRMENKRKESIFNNFWNKECLMDLASHVDEELRMEILSAYYISDNGKDGKIVFDVSFNCYKFKKYHDNDRCEFFIDYNPSKDKLEDVLISLYYEIEDLYKKKIVSLNKYMEFFNLNTYKEESAKYMDLVKNIYNVLKEDGFRIPVEESRWKSTLDSFAEKFKNNTVCGAFGDTNNIKNLKGDKMKTENDFKDLIKSFFGEEAAEKAVKFAKELKDNMTKAVDEVGKKACESKPSIDEAVEKVKDKTKSVFDKISTEIGEKAKTYKGSFNALKEPVRKDLLTEKEKTIIDDCVRDFFSKNQTSNLSKIKLDVTLSAIEVFVVNKVEICEQLIQTMEKYKMTNLGRSIELCDLPIDFDNKITVEDSDFVDMLEQFLLEDKWIDEELSLTDLEFITNITLDGVENNSYYIAKTSVGEMMDVYIKFVPVEYSIKY